MIDLTVFPEALNRSVELAKKRNIIIPTLKQQRDPSLIPGKIVDKLKNVGLWDLDPLNLFRISWQNEPKAHGGGYAGVNYLEFPKELTGVDARIIAVVGKYFPTGAHKVGAAFGCLVPRLVTGQFDPSRQKAVWPSTGNYCRGGAYDSALLGCESIAILPEEMSQERFEWLQKVAGRIIKTPGSESNVKEIFDKCRELGNSGEDLVIFNQFDELGNYLWHHEVTGPAMLKVLKSLMNDRNKVRGLVSATGSGGTIASGDFLKKKFPECKIVASEALQCPTLLNNGFGAHRIEGIGDKHIPWIHNARNTDFVVAMDDQVPMNLIRLFNEPAGKKLLREKGMPDDFINNLDLVGISGASNLASAIKFAKYNELTQNDLVVTVLTDSMDMYQSRLNEMTGKCGAFTDSDARVVYEKDLLGLTIDNMEELTYYGKKRIHNLKYYTWVEQQGKSYEEIQEQWYNESYWTSIIDKADEIDALIEEFNKKTGLLEKF
ncbi:MAG: pyridoxal-phosphate dependent enzyme [Deltaproteobacteria bacterium]|nr:pyridoxal-phosphate dependent enzyme [Deltaproteobacteria bacterium]